MLWKIIDTQFDYAVLFARLGVGTVALVHAYDNLMQSFLEGEQVGGVDFLVYMGMPSFLAWMVVFALTINALSLVMGFFARITSAIFLITAVGDVLRLALYQYYFMIWEMSIGSRDMEGIQFHLLIFTACLMVIVKGAGACSVDEYLVDKVDWDYIRVVWLNR